MSYCRKCGTRLEEDAKYCHVCGTPVEVVSAHAVQETRRPRRPMPVYLIAMILIAILLVAAVVALFLFLPLRSVNIQKSNSVPYQAGVNTLNLSFDANVADVNVIYQHLSDRLLVLNASMTGGTSLFYSTAMLNVDFSYTITENVLNVTSNVVTPISWMRPWTMNITCAIYIDPSLITNINVKTSVGRIVLDTQDGVILSSMTLETTTGAIEAGLAEGTEVGNSASLKTTTGGISVVWNNIHARDKFTLAIKTTTGGNQIQIEQDSRLHGNVTLTAETTTGGNDFTIAVTDGVGAYIQSQTTVGGIHVSDKVGFNGTSSPLQSTNYPDRSNFGVSLKTTIGGININATYTP